MADDRNAITAAEARVNDTTSTEATKQSKPGRERPSLMRPRLMLAAIASTAQEARPQT